MLYRVYFTTGQEISIDFVDFDDFVDVLNEGTKNSEIIDYITNEKSVIAMKYVTHIVLEDAIENPESSVVTRPSPQDIKNDEKKKQEEIRSDPKKILRRMKQKAEES